MVIKLEYGNTNTYFAQGRSGGLLIDTDYAGTLLDFYKSLKGNNISISDFLYEAIFIPEGMNKLPKSII